jgi:hypothetical protein
MQSKLVAVTLLRHWSYLNKPKLLLVPISKHKEGSEQSMVQASWQQLHVLSDGNRNFDSGAFWRFGDPGNESDLLQLQAEIRVTPGILKTHFLQEEGFKIVSTSIGTTKTVCWKWNDISAGIIS